MDTYKFIKGDLKQPGQYRIVMRDGKKIIKISCPKCGNIGDLADHIIHEDGTIIPSLVCPYKECDFHQMGKIESPFS